MTVSVARRVAIPLELAPFAVPAGAGVQKLAGRTMGTSWAVTFLGTDVLARSLERSVLQDLDLIIEQMSLWEPDSAISQFNRQPVGEWCALPEEFCDVVSAGLRIARETNGAFDPTVGAWVDLWGFGAMSGRSEPPSPKANAEKPNTSGWHNLEFDSARRRLRRLSDCRLDFNGIAKGFAVDVVMKSIRRLGIDHALVDIGGELSGIGTKADGAPWWVDIDRPAAADAPQGDDCRLRVALHGLAIATSGNERHFMHNGRRYSHTIDPRTGVPIDNGMITATVLHRSCMEADAYATALMVMGPDAAIAFAERALIAATILFVPEDGGGPISERVSVRMQAMLN